MGVMAEAWYTRAEENVATQTCAPTFRAALLMAAKKWKQLCPSTDDG